MRIRRLPALFGAGLFFLVFSAVSAAEPDKHGDFFVTASIAEPTSLIPFFATDSASAQISRLIFNGLVKYDKDLRLVGDLAERWEVRDDGLVLVFHLRKGVRWQDGAPFTADDVAFTFQKLTDPATPTPYGGDFEKVKSLRVLDPHTVEMTYKEPFAPALASWGMGMVPKHLLSAKNLLDTGFARKPVGTGPYRLFRWKSGEKIELEANRDYFEGRPFIDRYIYRIIPDTATMFLELLTENLDSAGLTPLQYRRQTQSVSFEKTFAKFRYPSHAYTYLGYNLKSPLFSDRRVRQAMGMAIPKQEIIDVTLLGLGQISTGPFLPGTWAYNPEVAPTAFDPEKARSILREAGWFDSDDDGVLEKEGKKFSFTLLTNQGNETRKMACEIIQRSLRELGIEAKIQIVEWGTFLREFIDKKRFEAVMLAWQLPEDPDCYDIFHSSRAEGGFNFISYANPEADRLLEEGRRLVPESARAGVYHRLHAVLSKDEPYTFLYVEDALPVVHRRFKGVEAAPAGIGHNFIRWFVPESERRYKMERAK